MVKVTVIMPSLNVASYIRECMESVIHQTLQELEIICVDAGSTDGTKEILGEYAQNDPRIRIVESPKKSYGYQVNLGIRLAKGAYLAILETDDYVRDIMYERLFDIADRERLDFILADFDRVWDDVDGKRQYLYEATWAEYPQMYGLIVGAERLKSYYTANSNLWRGLYSTDFLNRFQIRLNETPGAAYQDIGFWHRVTMHAERGMFIQDSLYRYRTDRGGSSTNSVNGLQYACREYQNLWERGEIIPGFEKRVYYMMSQSFVGEITQIAPRIPEHWTADNWEYYEWFRDKIQDGIRQGYLTEDRLGTNQWEMLQLLLNSLDGYISKILYPGNLYSILEESKDADVIIFGAGRRGTNLCEKVRAHANVVAFCDNAAERWNTEINGVIVLPIGECAARFPRAHYLIAVKNHAAEIRNQLENLGIDGIRIHVYKTDEEVRKEQPSCG